MKQVTRKANHLPARAGASVPPTMLTPRPCSVRSSVTSKLSLAAMVVEGRGWQPCVRREMFFNVDLMRHTAHGPLMSWIAREMMDPSCCWWNGTSTCQPTYTVMIQYRIVIYPRSKQSCKPCFDFEFVRR